MPQAKKKQRKKVRPAKKKARAKGRSGVVLGQRISEELNDRVANTVANLAGYPTMMTKVGLVTNALERECRRLEKKHNDGEPFSGPGGSLASGRRSDGKATRKKRGKRSG